MASERKIEVKFREVISHFYKDSSKRVRLNGLTVLEEKPDGYVQTSYDVDYSRQFGYIFHMSGAGGDNKIEVRGLYHITARVVARRLLGEPKGTLPAPKIVGKPPQWVDSRDDPPNQPRTQAIRRRNPTRLLERLPKAFDLEPGQDLLDWLQNNGIEGESVWCSTCRDYFPGENDYDLCKHVWWCDKIAYYSTPDDRCKCQDMKECRDR